MQAQDESSDYRTGWLAINRLVRQGFSWSGHERNCFYLNVGDGFVRADAVSGLDFDDDGRAAAAVDWDGDGDLDLLVTNRTGPRLRILRNDADAAPSLSMRLQGTQGNRDAIGARVQLKLTDGRQLIATRRAGEGYLASSGSWMHFGLGLASVESVSVRWPGGVVEEFIELTGPGSWQLVEGSGRAVAVDRPALAFLDEQETAPEPSSATRVFLPESLPLPRLPVISGAGKEATLFGVAEQLLRGPDERPPLLLNVWASWCAPCLVELADFQEHSELLREAGVERLALSADTEEARATAAQRLQDLGWTAPSGFASPEALEILDALQGALLGSEVRMPIPTSFLIDGRGNLAALYLGPVTTEQVLADVALLRGPEEARLAAALPYPGRWHHEPAEAGLTRFERAFEERGLPATAREYQPGAIHLHLATVYLQEGRLEDAERHYQLSLDAGPYFLEAYRGLGYTLAQAKRPADAANAYQAALQFAPNDPILLYSLGLMRLRNGEYDAVRTLIARLSTLQSPGAVELQKQLDAVGDEH